MIKKFSTDCCALAQLSITDETPLKEIEQKLFSMKVIANMRDWYGTPGKDYGQRNVFVITTPDEKNLVNNLRKLGFNNVAILNRRKGYPKGKIKMWTYSF